MCTEHPAVDGEHPGAKYEKSENDIADYLTHEDNKVFCVQSLIFVGVPEKVYCSNEKYKVLKILQKNILKGNIGGKPYFMRILRAIK